MSRPQVTVHRVTMRSSYPLYSFSVLIGLIALLTSCGSVASTQSPTPPAASQDVETLTQVSTYPALQLGEFDGDTTFAQLERNGDFGLGTFDGLDGEMIALDGVFYQAQADGSVHVVDPKMETPFADVHFFHSTQQVKIQQSLQSVDEL